MAQKSLFSQHKEKKPSVKLPPVFGSFSEHCHKQFAGSGLNIACQPTNAMTTKTEEPEITRTYICIDESAGRLVYRYYSELLSPEKAEGFEDHLLLCFRCQDIIFTLDSIFEALKANREEWLGPQKQSKEERVKASVKRKRSA